MTLTFKGVLFEARTFGTCIDRHFDVPWTEEGVRTVFTETVPRPKEQLQLWSAAQYKEGAKRGARGVELRYAAVLDADCMDIGELDRLTDLLAEDGYAFIAYTSSSHRRADKYHRDTDKHGPFDCFRLIVPYSRPVAPAEHAAIVPALFGHELEDPGPRYATEVLGRYVEASNGVMKRARPRGYDPVASRPSQAYFVPTHDSLILVEPGRCLDVDAVLARPMTARPSALKQRPLEAPTMLAVGALGELEKELAGRGVQLGHEGFEGWRRAPCPACAPDGNQKSPSFTARANGDGIDVRCYAGCSRRDIFGALGLSPTGVFAPPSHLRLQLDEQLAAQTPRSEAVTVGQAVEQLVVDIRDSVLARQPTVIQYPAGTGKAQPHSEPVLLERGWTPMGDVRVGDRVYGSDGKLHDVLAVHPQGLRPVYRVTFSDGSWARCDEHHLWTFRNHNGTWRTKTTSEWASLPLRKKSGRYHKSAYKLPIVSAIQRPDADLTVDPYTLGLLLGDGSMSQRAGLGFTSMDEELIEALVLPAGVVRVRRTSDNGRARTVGLTTATSFGGYGRNTLLAALKALGLQGTNSYTKFVPASYLHASAKQRLAVLQGLFDTDGSVSGAGVEYTTASTLLADHVQELVESLGGSCSRTTKVVRWGDGRGLEYQRMHLRMPRGMRPFRLGRKAAEYAKNELARQRDVMRAVVSIERDGEEECSCITVSAPDHLYVTRRHILTHNSHASAIVITELVNQGYRVAYSTQEHAVAHETRSKLPPHVRSQSVHIHSPLIQVGSEPVCARADELKEQVFDYGVSLLKSVCPRCPLRRECEAYAAAKLRAKQVDKARAVFVSHSGISQVFGTDKNGLPKGADTLLIVDEMPGAFERVEVPPDLLHTLAKGASLVSADPVAAKAVAELARAALEKREPGDVRWGPGGSSLGNALAIAQKWGRLSAREGAKPKASERTLLRAGDALMRLAVQRDQGEVVEGWDTAGSTGVAAMVPDACHEALCRRQGVLLSATPLMPALGGFSVRAASVMDGARVRRVMVLRSQRGSGALLESYYDDSAGHRRRRAPEPGEAPGIPWPWVDAALKRAIAEADQYGPKSRVLFVTFKALADVLRTDPDRQHDGRIEWAHYGALRGKNDWMEGQPRECQALYCFGTPRFAIYSTLIQLGLDQEAASQQWAAYAAGELTQAEGRLRLPRRSKPCTVVVEGDVAPLSWHAGNVDVVDTSGHTDNPTATELLEEALAWMPLADLAERLCLSPQTVAMWRQPGRPPPSAGHVAALRGIARPSIRDAMGQLNDLTPQRRQHLLAWLSWVPLDAE